MQGFAAVPHLMEAFSEYTPTMLGAFMKRVLRVGAGLRLCTSARALFYALTHYSDYCCLGPLGMLKKHALFVESFYVIEDIACFGGFRGRWAEFLGIGGGCKGRVGGAFLMLSSKTSLKPKLIFGLLCFAVQCNTM